MKPEDKVAFSAWAKTRKAWDFEPHDVWGAACAHRDAQPAGQGETDIAKLQTQLLEYRELIKGYMVQEKTDRDQLVKLNCELLAAKHQTAPTVAPCEHQYHYFGDQKVRRCNKCCALEPAVAVNKDLAKAIHYPQCWDVAAYPTLAHAISELATCFQCCECVKNPAVAVNEQLHSQLEIAAKVIDLAVPKGHQITAPMWAAIAAAEAAKGGSDGLR